MYSLRAAWPNSMSFKAVLGSSMRERFDVMASFTLKVDKSMASDLASEIDLYHMPSWLRVTFSSAAA